jgi:hypothetical protein
MIGFRRPLFQPFPVFGLGWDQSPNRWLSGRFNRPDLLAEMTPEAFTTGQHATFLRTRRGVFFASERISLRDVRLFR